MIINLIEGLQKATPYMLRNDGTWLTCGLVHPYIKYIIQDTNARQIYDLLTGRPDHLKWFYDNTLNIRAKHDIETFVSALVSTDYFNLPTDTIEFLKQTYPIKATTASKSDIEAVFEKLNDDLNQEFCRVRTSNLRWAGDSNSIYFRISSIEFNWFDLIWKVVYENKNFISDVTICKDTQTFGGALTYYKHGNLIINELPVNDFITLSGKPVIESNNVFVNRLRQAKSLDETFGERHPYHTHKCYSLFIEDYLNYNFE